MGFWKRFFEWILLLLRVLEFLLGIVGNDIHSTSEADAKLLASVRP